MARFSWKSLFTRNEAKVENTSIVEPATQVQTQEVDLQEQQKLNGEFALLEVKLGELRVALLQLRDAMSQLESIEQTKQEDHALLLHHDHERLN